MAIKRYIATKDTTITDAYELNNTTRATGSNMGESDTLEVFSLYGQATTASVEKQRILVKFDTDAIETDRGTGTIPASGSVSFYLKLFNAENPYTLPKDFYLLAKPISADWDEGQGLDMDSYEDSGYANWDYRTSTQAWAADGGDFVEEDYSQHFDSIENLELDISEHIEQVIAGGREDYGMAVMLSGSYEDGTQLRSFFKKSFFARNSEYFFRRPIIEARWDDSKGDDIGLFKKT